MELHRKLGSIEGYKPHPDAGPTEYFEKALSFTREFYASELARIESTKFKEVTPDFFFLEYMWVVHATGFSAKVVGSFMGRLVEAYGPWEVLAKEDLDPVIERVRKVVNNPRKLTAVWKTAGLLQKGIDKSGWEDFKSASFSTPESLVELPFIGKITCYHLARNIGLLESVKPDLHLVRLADHWGFNDCITMCEAMRDAVEPSLPLGIVDLALWFCASTFGTLHTKKSGQR